MSANGPQPQVIQMLADQAVERFPETTLESLAVDLETDAGEHPETAEVANAIAFELRLRAAAGKLAEMDRIRSGAELKDADLVASAYRLKNG